MRLTKFGHACVRLEKDEKRIVIDPGEMTPEPEAMDGARAALVTHEHFDHFSAEKLLGAAQRDPAFEVYTCSSVANRLGAMGSRAHTVREGDTFSAAGFRVKVVGEHHARNHPDRPLAENIGFLVDGDVFHPGDALTVTPARVLLVPAQAPWMSSIDLVNYMRAFRPARAFSIHEGLLNEWGLRLVDGALAAEGKHLGIEARRLAPGESVEL